MTPAPPLTEERLAAVEARLLALEDARATMEPKLASMVSVVGQWANLFNVSTIQALTLLEVLVERGLFEADFVVGMFAREKAGTQPEPPPTEQRLVKLETDARDLTRWMKVPFYLSAALLEAILKKRDRVTLADVMAEIEAMRERQIDHATMMSDLERDLMNDWWRRARGGGP